MQKNLSHLAQIISGYTFRGSIENNQNGDVFVLQAKNFNTNSDIEDVTSLDKVESLSVSNRFFLQRNDILIVSKGYGLGSFKSSVFTSNVPNVVASSSIHIIRVEYVSIIPKFLSLYLNSEEGQKKILKKVTGSNIQSLLIKNLSELEIPVPPMHIQKSIIALHENMQAQEKIQERKNELKKTIINATFTNLINK